MQTCNMRVSGQLSADCQGIITSHIHRLFCGIVKKKKKHEFISSVQHFTQLLAFNTLVSFCLCLCLCPPEQLIIYQVGVLPSHFYNVLGDKDYAGFKSLLGKAMVLILLNSTVSSWIHECAVERWPACQPTVAQKEFQACQQGSSTRGPCLSFHITT